MPLVHVLASKLTMVSPTTVEIQFGAKLDDCRAHAVADIMFRIPVPSDASSAVWDVSVGTVKWDDAHEALLWRIKKLPPSKVALGAPLT